MKNTLQRLENLEIKLKKDERRFITYLPGERREFLQDASQFDTGLFGEPECIKELQGVELQEVIQDFEKEWIDLGRKIEDISGGISIFEIEV